MTKKTTEPEPEDNKVVNCCNKKYVPLPHSCSCCHCHCCHHGYWVCPYPHYYWYNQPVYNQPVYTTNITSTVPNNMITYTNGTATSTYYV